MDVNDAIDLGQLHENIVAAIAEAFPGVATVAAYPEEDERQQLVAPAILIELAELEAAPDRDPGTEQLAMMAKFEALVIVHFRALRAKYVVRMLAADLARFVLRKRWGLPVGPAVVLGAYRDEFDPNLDEYEVFRVEWQQIVNIGPGVWKNDGVVPGEPLYSWAPKIGTPFRDNYRPLDEGGAIPE